MLFTETPYLQSLERQMTEIPRHRDSYVRCSGRNQYSSAAVKLALRILLDSFDCAKLEKRMKGILLWNDNG